MIKKDWESEFGTTPPNIVTGTRTGSVGRLYSTESAIYIFRCLFKEVEHTSDGGAIYVNSTCSMLVEETSFEECSISGGSGGSIYFVSSSRNAVLNKVCGFKSSSKNNGDNHFCYIDQQHGRNEAIFLSVCKGGFSGSSTNNACFLHGRQIMKSNNFSDNSCSSNSAIINSHSENPDSSSYFSSFIRNNASISRCIRFDNIEQTLLQCSIIGNTQGLNSQGHVHITSSNIILHMCILLDNSVNCPIISQEMSNIFIKLCQTDVIILPSQSLQIGTLITLSFSPISLFSINQCNFAIWEQHFSNSCTTLCSLHLLSTYLYYFSLLLIVSP